MMGLRVALRSTSRIRLDAEFDCAAGELVALVGPSGSGKTSILRAIAGLWRLPGLSGHIRVQGRVWFDSTQDINLAPQARRAGLVFQHYALFPHMSATANVALAADKHWTAQDIAALLDRMGLTGLGERKPVQLSGGQQQRVALARALVRVMSGTSSQSDAGGVLLLDEPFSAVDAPTRLALYRELAALRQQVGAPMLLVTHDLAEARRLADRVVILDAGESLQTGVPAHVFASPRNARVAQLVGIQNHFEGRFDRHAPGWGRLTWGAQSGAEVCFKVVDKNRIADGTAVTWVLNGEFVEVKSADEVTMGSGSNENVLRCEILEILSLGETSLCTMTPEGLAGERITLQLPGQMVRKGQWQAGTPVQLSIAPQALHIMPVK
ncbi:ABC transporter ATP-binding protein [Limnohabitans sp. Rim8]|uniref:ABC transporter ATP-binding protein n=1 Tax=Limnohabitans sp. Rim8 TaxID=1100718 RepID=UPI00261C7B27|nr:ABC transporter ATP-binding protein [Limnohabitans sp. Rim8]